MYVDSKKGRLGYEIDRPVPLALIIFLLEKLFLLFLVESLLQTNIQACVRRSLKPRHHLKFQCWQKSPIACFENRKKKQRTISSTSKLHRLLIFQNFSGHDHSNALAVARVISPISGRWPSLALLLLRCIVQG